MGLLDINSFDTRRRSGLLFEGGRRKDIGSVVRRADPNVIYVDRSAKGAGDNPNGSDPYLHRRQEGTGRTGELKRCGGSGFALHGSLLELGRPNASMNSERIL